MGEIISQNYQKLNFFEINFKFKTLFKNLQHSKKKKDSLDN